MSTYSTVVLVFTVAAFAGATVAQAADCPDIPPTSKYTCAEQKAFGKCGAPFMADYCWVTCGRECPKCSDVPPTDEYTCAQQKDFGKCEQDGFMTYEDFDPSVFSFCMKTCGRCESAGAPGVQTTRTDNGQTTTEQSTAPGAAASASATGDVRSASTSIDQTNGGMSVSSSASSCSGMNCAGSA